MSAPICCGGSMYRCQIRDADGANYWHCYQCSSHREGAQGIEIEFTEDEVAEMSWSYNYPDAIRLKFASALPEPCDDVDEGDDLTRQFAEMDVES